MKTKKKLNPNARKWVAALRSGKYRQTKGFLHKTGGGFCCLGVACDLYDRSIGILSSDTEGVTEYDGCTESLPNKVREWLGLRDGSGVFIGSSLVGLNDEGKRFKTIAKVIESMPEGLFK